MTRRAALVSLGSAGALALATLVVSPAALSAPAPAPRNAAADQRAADRGTPKGDRDGDQVSDDFAARLRAAGPSERLAVIITGLRASAALSAVGRFDVTHRLPIIDGFSAVMTARQARALAQNPSVRRVEADGGVSALDDATNADFGATAARADRAGLDGSGVGICVVDTGIDPNHEQLSGRVDGWYDAVNGRSTPYDDHGHGTHVSSIAAGDGTGSSSAASFMGVAPAARLYAAKVLDAQGSGSDSQVVAGVNWCHGQAGVSVITMSLGDTTPSDGTDALSLAVDKAVSEGDVVTVAAGNSGDEPETINAPGVARGAITVGAVSDWSAPAGTDRHDDGIWLAPFSSRGPTVDGRMKPDVTAPGYSVTAAKAGTTSGYTTMSGTSMATPYVAGSVALALQADSAATPAGVRSAMTATAADRGIVGPDYEWGAGLVDVRALVDAVAQNPDQSFDVSTVRHNAFPTLSTYSGTVPDNGYVDVPVSIPSGGSGVPIALTMTTTSGGPICYWGCLIVEWGPDLDLELRTQGGTVLAKSECALSGLICGIGRQETIGYANPTAGSTYVARVYAYTGDPNYGDGGTFTLDVSRGPTTGTVVTPPPPPPSNNPPTVDAGPDATYRLGSKKTVTFTLNGSATDSDGQVVAYRWTLGTTVVGSSASISQTLGKGTYTYTLTATDDDGATASDTVKITIRR